MIIEAYQCEVTGKKFFIKEEYENYSRVIKNKQRALSFTKLPKILIEQKFFEMRETSSTEDELNKWINDNLWVFDAAIYTHGVNKPPTNLTIQDIKNESFIKSIHITNLRINNLIPRFNYKSSYSVLPSYDNDDSVDRFQVGLTGKIFVEKKSFNDTEYTRKLPIFSSNIISRISGIHIGSGGGSYSSLNYQAHLLTSEWPRFAEKCVMEKLSNI